MFGSGGKKLTSYWAQQHGDGVTCGYESDRASHSTNNKAPHKGGA